MMFNWLKKHKEIRQKLSKSASAESFAKGKENLYTVQINSIIKQGAFYIKTYRVSVPT